MKNLLAACAAASLTLGSAWAQDRAPVAAANKASKKEAEKRSKPKPTKKSKKPAARSSNP